jgi:hypothetical protein
VGVTGLNPVAVTTENPNQLQISDWDFYLSLLAPHLPHLIYFSIFGYSEDQANYRGYYFFYVKK